MNIENFKKEFKMYCETVEDTVALDVIKDEMFKTILDVQKIVDLYINVNECDNKKKIERTKMLISSLESRTSFSEYIEGTEWRELYKIVNKFSVFEITEIFEIAIAELSEYVHDKYDINLLNGEELSTEQLENEKWFTDLCDLADKYDIC